MLMFLRIERPTTQTLRPTSTATSIACCMRWTFEAKDATRIAALAQRDDLPEGLADEPLRAGHARPLGVRRVAEQEVDAAVADLGEPADVGAQAVDGRVVDLVVAGVQRCGRPASRARSRPRPGSSAPSGRTPRGTARAAPARRRDRPRCSSAARSRPCSSSFDLTSPSVSRVAQTSGTRASRRRYGSAPTWSSCPCVSRTARTGLSRSRRYVKSGRTGRRRGARRAGTRGPRRRRSISPSASKTVMFLPTSPRPPSGMIRVLPGIGAV